jgi:hypothetical protein
MRVASTGTDKYLMTQLATRTFPRALANGDVNKLKQAMVSKYDATLDQGNAFAPRYFDPLNLGNIQNNRLAARSN